MSARTEIYVGECLYVLRSMAADSVNCIVTSPPYYGLRDYGDERQIGLEPSPQAYVTRLVETFREARRVLKRDGVLWVNLGDSYNAAGRTGHGEVGPKQLTNRSSAVRQDQCRPNDNKLKVKDLLGIPWRVAFGLQDDGWLLRQDIIWSKPAPMPESVADRCTRSHEYVFLLAKSRFYWWDRHAMSEPTTTTRVPGVIQAAGYSSESGRKDKTPHRSGVGFGVHETRNRRSVWTIAPTPFEGSHYATMPTTLADLCIRASCPKGGVVLDLFGGAGTTALAANRSGRHGILIELNPDYAKMAYDRILSDRGMFADVRLTTIPNKGKRDDEK